MGMGFYLAWVATFASAVPALMTCRLVMLDVVDEEGQPKSGLEDVWDQKLRETSINHFILE
eukprot:5564389-Amphidinium_carterae.1